MITCFSLSHIYISQNSLGWRNGWSHDHSHDQSHAQSHEHSHETSHMTSHMLPSHMTSHMTTHMASHMPSHMNTHMTSHMTMHISLIPRLRGTREICLSSHAACVQAIPVTSDNKITSDLSMTILTSTQHNSISQVLQVLQLVATITTTRIITTDNRKVCTESFGRCLTRTLALSHGITGKWARVGS